MWDYSRSVFGCYGQRHSNHEGVLVSKRAEANLSEHHVLSISAVILFLL